MIFATKQSSETRSDPSRDSPSGDSPLELRTRALLLESTEALPGHLRSQLTQARHAALRAHAAPLRYRLQRWVPAGAMAAAVLTLLVVFVPHGRPLVPNQGLSGAVEDIDLLTSDVPLTTDQSDENVGYDFYEWAVDAAHNGGPSGAQTAVHGS